MKNTNSILEKFFPYIVMGASVVLVVVMLFLFFYLIIWGAIIGAVIWLAVTIKNYFMPPIHKAVKNKGRVIEHEKD